MLVAGEERTRSYLFTWNNYTELDIEYLRNEVVKKSKYVVWGKEIAPTTGTPHLQGWVYFANGKSFNACQTLLPKCHLTPVAVDNGCAKYSMKDGDYEEHGVRPMTGKRKSVAMNDGRAAKAAHIIELAQEGNLEAIKTEYPIEFISKYKTLKDIKKDYMKPVPDLSGPLTNEWRWGPKGTGKTRTVCLEYPGYYDKMCNKWWDGYQGEDVVLIDDLDENHKCLVHHLKVWAQHKPFIAETKNGAIKIRPKKIIVTSNCRISDLAVGVHREALERRFDEIYYDEPYDITKEEGYHLMVDDSPPEEDLEEEIEFTPEEIQCLGTTRDEDGFINNELEVHEQKSYRKMPKL
jgi:hypothetical protein